MTASSAELTWWGNCKMWCVAEGNCNAIQDSSLLPSSVLMVEVEPHAFSKLPYAKLQMFLFLNQINYFLSCLPVLSKGPKMVAVRNYHGTPAPPGKSSLCFQTGDYIELLKGDPDTAWWEVQHAIASVRKYKLLWGWKPLFHAVFSCFNLYRNLQQAVK